ncbi:MAG: L,D-transpeptidase family protein [Parcubacteria group bacterium]|jgi:lipoprotein-anchoring transpeptidase ErfK/SrfK
MKKIKQTFFFILFLLPTLLTGVYIYAYSPSFVITPLAPKTGQVLLPSDPFTIQFDKPIDIKYYQSNLDLSPRTPMTAVINNDHTQITLTPTTTWTIGQAYTLDLPAGRATNFMPIDSAQFVFSISARPQVIDVVPATGAVDVRLDIEDPITIQFDKSTEGFYIDFQLDPPIDVKYQNNERKTQFDILPQKPLADGTRYTLTIRSKALNAPDDTYTTIHTTSFTTLAPKPKTWAENLQERVEQAKKFTVAQIKTGKYIDVNLATQIMTTFENGRIIDSYLISSGKAGMPTPKGTHRVYNKNPRPWSKQYGLYMPFWMAITGDGKYGIHELPEWPGGYKEGQNHLGIPVSHGCMRLGVGPAKKVYDWADIGTPVIVY